MPPPKLYLARLREQEEQEEDELRGPLPDAVWVDELRENDMGKRQKSFEGMEPPSNPEVDKAAEAYQRAAKAKKKAGEAAKQKMDSLIETMKRNKVFDYKDLEASPPLHIVLSAKDKVTVKELPRPDPVRDDEGKDDKEEDEEQAKH